MFDKQVLFLQLFVVIVVRLIASGNGTTATTAVCDNDTICLCGSVANYLSVTSQPHNLTRAAAWIGNELPVKPSFPARIVVCEKLEQFPQNNSWELDLTALVLRNGKISEIKRSYIEHFTRLEFVDFSRNKITWIERTVFSSLPNLQEVDLSYNQLRCIDLDVNFATFSSIPVMRLRANPIQCTCALWNLANQVVLIPSDDYFSCVIYAQTIHNCQLNNSNTGQEETMSEEENWLGAVEGKIDFSSKYKLEDEFKRICEREQTKQPSTVASTSSGGVSYPTGEDATTQPATTPINGVDVNLLVIMALWFFMVYFGINKFIKDNMLDKDMCMEYNLFDRVVT